MAHISYLIELFKLRSIYWVLIIANKILQGYMAHHNLSCPDFGLIFK